MQNTHKPVVQNNRPVKVLTWHVHGNYLYYLTQVNCEFYLPVKNPPVSGYFGRTKSFPWGNNVFEIPADEVKNREFDCILFQSNYNPVHPTHNYLQEQMEILSDYQRKYVPQLFIEHDPPRMHPTDTKHPLYNSETTLVHVTAFNNVMWDSGTTPIQVIEHGVMTPPEINYTGEIAKGVVVVNNLAKRGRRLGLDVFEEVRKVIPLDIIGMGSEVFGGLGEVPPQKLASVIAKYRFFFHPARYTSLGLSILEAMTIGMPVVGLATTELPTVITNGKNGFIHTDIGYLIQKMKDLLLDKKLALQLGMAGKRTALQRFNITRFASDWETLFARTVFDVNFLKRNKPAEKLQAISAV